MATTPQPLVWDFCRSVENVKSLGTVAHYFDESSQSLYIDNDSQFATQYKEIPEGHWRSSGAPKSAVISNVDWTHLRFDHPSNGILYGVASNGSSIEFVRYVYMVDCSSILESYDYRSNIDSAIDSTSYEIQNIGSDYFTDDLTLFQPGGRIITRFKMGDSAPLPLSVAWIDEVNYDITSRSVPISARNTVSKLHDQTFDRENLVIGASESSAKMLLEAAGIEKYSVAPRQSSDDNAKTFEFDPSDTLMSGIEQMNEYYRADEANDWKIRETPKGVVLYGDDQFISDQMSNGYFIFNEKSGVFSRNTKRALDGAYSHVYVKGVALDGETELWAWLPVQTFKHWLVGTHKTKHIETKTPMDETTFKKWAQDRADELQYVGIIESFESPFRPDIICGDVASVEKGNDVVSLGIITSVSHTYSRTRGYATSFTADSGGVLVDGDNMIVYSKTAKTGGYNRAQNVSDLIKIIKGV